MLPLGGGLPVVSKIGIPRVCALDDRIGNTLHDVRRSRIVGGVCEDHIDLAFADENLWTEPSREISSDGSLSAIRC
jgi:hypothetical protein